MPVRLSLRDLAHLAGVSVTTASNAMRGTGRVAPATRERIRTLAAEHGYRPDPALSALVTHRDQHRPRTVRVAVLERSDEKFFNKTRYHIIRHHACERMQAFGYRWVTVDAAQLPQDLDLSAWCDERSFHGLLVLSLSWDATRQRVDRRRMATVVVGRGGAGVAFDRVGTDDFHDLQLAYDQLRAQGHRRIGLVLHPHTDLQSRGRWSGAWAVARELHGDRASGLRCTEQNRPAALAAWLRRRGPSAVIFVADVLQHLLTALAEVPGPRPVLARVGLREPHPQCVGILHDLAGLGRLSAELLDLHLRRGERSDQAPTWTLLPGRWTDVTAAQDLHDSMPTDPSEVVL